MKTTRKPTLSVWKFASCDGCQLTLLDCEDELLAVAEQLDIAYFLEASSATADGPYDIALIEGSITTPHDAERIRDIRRQSRFLITIGACATAGGIQSLRNFADVDDYLQIVYASPEFISTLDTSTAISEHVDVDFELRGCPIDRNQLLEVISAHLAGRKPVIPTHSVCIDCKQRGHNCVIVAHGTPCLGPITQTGCGALCPGFDRGCYGCFGPTHEPNLTAMTTLMRTQGVSDDDIERMFHTYNAWAEPFRALPIDAPTRRPARQGGQE